MNSPSFSLTDHGCLKSYLPNEIGFNSFRKYGDTSVFPGQMYE